MTNETKIRKKYGFNYMNPEMSKEQIEDMLTSFSSELLADKRKEVEKLLNNPDFDRRSNCDNNYCLALEKVLKILE